MCVQVFFFFKGKNSFVLSKECTTKVISAVWYDVPPFAFIKKVKGWIPLDRVSNLRDLQAEDVSGVLEQLGYVIYELIETT
jgi:hypothetical protein